MTAPGVGPQAGWRSAAAQRGECWRGSRTARARKQIAGVAWPPPLGVTGGLAHLALAGALAAQAPTPAAAPAQAATERIAPRGVRVSWRPERPRPGTLIELAVRPRSVSDSAAPLGGTVAGEPLHFAWDGRGAFRAVAAIPIDAADSVTAPVILRPAAAAETVLVRIPLAASTYPTEQLRVAPKFGREPDSALAARLAAEAERALGIARNAHGTSRLWRGAFQRPRPARVTSGFGRQREFNGTIQSRHLGADFAGAPGAPVYAANRGVVALVADFYLGGRVVYLDHGAGLVTGYFHLSRAVVATGDTVVRGQRIGRVGATGRVTGPHLHWVARYGAVTVDPLSLLALGSSPPHRAPGASAGRRQRR